MHRSATLLFSDVDGTLLDRHGRYAMTAAELSPFLDRLSIVLASSRTVLELSRNQRALGIDGPVVAENGAVIAMPWAAAGTLPGTREVIDDREWCVLRRGPSAEAIRDVVRATAAGLGTPVVDQIDVEPTLGRDCSVLVRPAPGHDHASLDPLTAALTAHGYAVASGGSWLAVTRDADKGIGARVLLEAQSVAGWQQPPIAAVGDADNDVPLLWMAERRFVIRRPDGSWHPELQAIPSVRLLLPPGIAGWRDVIETIAAAEDSR